MRALAIALCPLALLAWPAQGAGAESEGTFGEIESSASRTNRGVEVGLTENGGVGETVTIGDSSLEECQFFRSLAGSEVTDRLGSTPFVISAIDPDTDRFTLVVCPGPEFLGSSYRVWPEGDPLPEVVAGWLGREALARAEVPLPTPHGSPDGEVVPHLVNLPAWWWLDDDDWRVVEGTAALGPWSITAVLTPVHSRWLVDGRPPVVCGRGIPQQPGRDEEQSGWCGTTFTDISDGVGQTVSVVFDVGFRCLPAPMCATLPAFNPIVVSTTTQIRIVQAKGVILN